MTKAGKKLIAAAQEAVAVARGDEPAASITVGGHTYVPKPGWLPVHQCALDSFGLLLLGETIPDMPDVRVGTRISGESAEEIGYREYAKYGGWLIWNSGADFYVIDLVEPLGWMPVPA